ncbi:O-antigen ligase family protein [Natronococcus jeotgali]|uniref:O-antigen polymerase n=1 Tax=Natronococcus jeotgali DSM 18795 TaxID=1227498 RepID=L9X1W4_9EURY|nr:O-antigen ligase family protein [Natronococcus jeotgali]ELY55720.1 O-antigen polymerase [Natronococcus jeotgali DSM 18795]
MSAVEREPATPFARDWDADRLVDGIVYALFGLHLLLLLLAYATDLVVAWQVAAFGVLLGAALGCRLAADAYPEFERRQAAVLSVFGVTFVVLGVLYQSSSPGLGLGPNRPLAIAVAFGATVAFFLVVSDARRYTVGQWAAVGCFAVLTALYLVHTLEYDPSSTQSRWPLWAAAVLGVNLFVVPRLVPVRVYLWVLPRLAAVLVLVGLATYAVGEYSLWIFEVRQWSGTPSVPLVDADVTTLQSIFPNPNAFGLVSFAGLVGATVEFHRSVLERRPLGAGLALALAGLCAAGVFLSNARAAMLASAIAVAIYAAYAFGGRLAVPVVSVAGLVGAAGLLVGMYVGAVDITASGRFELWTASLRAIADGPLLFGHGSGPANLVIEPYLEGEGAPLPHNAYLTVLVQTGFVGGLAYLGLVAGSVVAGLIDYQRVDVATLAFAVGWAVHQFFESYTLFEWSIGGALASITIGYLLVRQED